jgi:hypothetical protein
MARTKAEDAPAKTPAPATSGAKPSKVLDTRDTRVPTATFSNP